MPASETSVLSLGSWIGAFPAVYAVAAIAVGAASAVFIDWAAGMVKKGREAGRAKAIGTRVAGSEA